MSTIALALPLPSPSSDSFSLYIRVSLSCARVYYPYIVDVENWHATYYYLVGPPASTASPGSLAGVPGPRGAGGRDARRRAGPAGPDRSQGVGAVAASWGVLEDLGVAAVIDEVAGPGPSGLPLSAGSYLVLAALNRLVAPCSKAAFADWWKTTAAARFTKIPATALDHRRFWDAMHAVTLDQLAEISRRVAVRIVQATGVDVSSVALDMTNFATFIATGNGKAPVAQRGKAKQKRADLRLVGLGLVVTRDGGSR